MPRGKPSKASTSAQKSISSYFSKNTSKTKDEDTDSSEDEVATIAPTTTATGADASDLPPIHDIPAMFSDLVSRVPEIKRVAEHIQGRKLRVATMCSGTESPLLALDLIRKSILEQFDVELDVEHVFSCEIEPFKQAYIERNFHPPLLFRDVCELGETHATTAYGAIAPVPGDVDLLVAGTSCVDYSNLNNEKQDLDANGESGRTFRGMMSWVKNHRPPLVILENVCSAPWDRVASYFAKVGYSATYKRVDTKHFYIPHTRTRVYLFAVDKENTNIPDEWMDLTAKLKRPASSTLDAFLLPSDDPRIHHSREKLVQESYNALDRRTGRTDWGRCESRHQRARLEEGLGSKRPLTGWDEGGFCKLPDYAWGDWGVGQVERVWDLMDITLLRSAKTGVDPCYKTQVWNLSQNVDRTIGSSKAGICPCLTPSMIPYITNRGGPLVGLEALSMQGLPVDKLLLTRETEDQLADLAGNAMSSTVVGACIVAALVTGRKLLKAGREVMDVDVPQGEPVGIEGRITGEDQLKQQALDLSIVKEHSLARVLANAEHSARLCECEGRKDITERVIHRCLDCGATSCMKCGGRPEHNFEPVDVTANPRLHPSSFADELKAVLPMCFSVTNVTQDLLDQLQGSAGLDVPRKRWSPWCAAVIRAVEYDLRFVELKRQEIWSAVYRSSTALFELLLHPQQPEWRLYGVPEDSDPASAEIRQLLQMPVARFVCKGDLLTGRWELALPHLTSVPLTIEGVGDLVPAWESRLGLVGDESKDRTVWSKLKITVPADQVNHLDRDVSGVYMLLDRCGTAGSALHKKESPKDDTLPPLFMLLDPSRCGDPNEDSFVFSISKRRYEFGESRPLICKLDSKWRQSDIASIQSTTCHIPYQWVPAEAIKLQRLEGQRASSFVPSGVLQLAMSNEACSSATALLVCEVDLRSQAGPEWPRGEWREVDKIHERATYKNLAFLTQRIRNLDDHCSSWQSVDLSAGLSNCNRCSPTPPTITWAKINKKAVAIENTSEAGEYERRLKKRPAPFVTQLKLTEQGTGVVRIGINIHSILHRALSRLPTVGRTEAPTLSWRLDTKFIPMAKLNLPKFKLESNKYDMEHAQPPSFKLPLRTEQLRSLEWMLKQEARNADPFVEEEISEAILEHLGWRAEGCAQRPVHVRGGVLADQVGYGKTAITLGLVDCAAKDVKDEFSKIKDMKGKIPVKATLIVVPPHLTRQWNSEVTKFTGSSRFKTVVLSTATSLNSLTIKDVQDADMVIVASNLFKSAVYLANLEAFAADGALPSQDGRYFNARLKDTLTALREQVDRLRDDGPAAVEKEIRSGREKDEDAEAQRLVPTKRLKGKTYRDVADKVELKKPKGDVTSQRGGPSGLKMEVVIPLLPGKKVSNSSRTMGDSSQIKGTADKKDDGDEGPSSRSRTRRAVKRHVIHISDDDDDKSHDTSSDYTDEDRDEEELPPRKNAAKNGRPLKRPLDSSSDLDDDATDETASDSDFAEDSEEDKPKRGVPSKSKGLVKSVKKIRLSASSGVTSTSSDVGDNMDIDDIESKPKKVLKRKADNDKERNVKKQKRREDADPWKLQSASVKRDWTQMQAPPLEIFHFARKVVDEYTYLDGKVHSLVTSITAERHWVLSGTPPIHDFAALKTIAAFLNLHLGVDDDGEGSSIQVKKRRREQTAVEKFHSFREVHSLEWHAHRHELGQIFLNRFVRQNIAEIDEIPWSEKIEEVVLPAAERAIYLELEHHLRALDMTIKRGKKTESDREKRLAKSLGESSTAEEALLKRCSHFDLDTSDKENAMKACEVIVQERTKQLDECKSELLKKLREAIQMEKKIGKVEDESMFQEYVRVSRTEGVGDKEASKDVNKLLDEAGVAAPRNSASSKTNDTRAKNKAKGKDDIPTKIKDLIWEHREHTHDIRRLTKELVGRVRSLRYFTVVRDLQKQTEEPLVLPCPGCGRKEIPMDEVAVLSSCGHVGCLTCVKSRAEKEECVYSASGDCNAAARVLNIVKGDTLGVDDEARDGHGKHFGLKLEKTIQLIKKRIATDERVLIFVQFPDLMKKVAEALTANKIKFLEIKGSASQKSKNLEQFQNDSKERVLLLNVMDESASGANLTSANHAIFLSPLLAPSQEIYDACETQAIGRLRRYGQTKHVNIWRFLTTNTIDMEIYEQRTGIKVGGEVAEIKDTNNI